MSFIKKLNDLFSFIFLFVLFLYFAGALFWNIDSLTITDLWFISSITLILLGIDFYRDTVYGSLYVAFDMPFVISLFFIFDSTFTVVTAYTLTMVIILNQDYNFSSMIKTLGRQVIPLLVAGIAYSFFSNIVNNTMFLVCITLSTYAILNYYILYLAVYAKSNLKLNNVINLPWALTFYIIQFVGILAIVELYFELYEVNIFLAIGGVFLGYGVCILCISILNNMMDIGKNKRIYKESLNYFIEFHNYGFLALDHKYNVLAFNEKMLDISQITDKNILGKPVLEVFSNSFMAKYLGRCKGEYDLLDHFYEPTTERYYSLNFLKVKANEKPLKDKLVSFLILIKDVTEEMEKQKEENIKNKLESLEQLAAGTANEIKNPLTVASGFLQLTRQKIEKGCDNNHVLLSYIENIEEALNQTGISLERLTITANSCLNEERLRWIDLSVLLKEVTNDYKSRFSNIDFNIEANNLKAFVDIRLLSICLNYILQNSVEAILEKNIDEGLLEVQGYTEGSNIKIDVIDNGVGFGKDQYLKIFDPYYTTKDNANQGLGLYYCNCIIKKLRGNIEVVSKLNQGTKVTITLPEDLNGKLEY
ncbi:ATP-binding protein [Proteinivorax tanatarense]|uniref:histidine kinase n=1 Tax=Proteinivorax tanatarense TaxID=1260629 RepID=A0AAU7VHW5_9FIRM